MTATMDAAPPMGQAPANLDSQGADPMAGQGMADGGGVRLNMGNQYGPPPPEGEEPASPEEQAEYERVMDEIIDVVYGESGGDRVSDSIADSIQPGDTVGSMIQTGTMLIGQMDKKLDMDDTVIPQVVEDVTEILADVAETKNGVALTQEELEASLMGIWEGVMYLLGGDAPIEPDFQEATQGMSQQDLAAMQQEYDARLGNAAEMQDKQQTASLGTAGVNAGQGMPPPPPSAQGGQGG